MRFESSSSNASTLPPIGEEDQENWDLESGASGQWSDDDLVQRSESSQGRTAGRGFAVLNQKARTGGSGDRCLWRAKSLVKRASADDWEFAMVWLDSDGVLWAQKHDPSPQASAFAMPQKQDSGGPIVKLAEGSFQARQLRFREECSKPWTFAVAPNSAEAGCDEILVKTQPATMRAFFGYVAQLRRARRWKDLKSGIATTLTLMSWMSFLAVMVRVFH